MLGMKYKVLQGKCCSSWNPLPWLKGKRDCVHGFFLLFVGFLHFVLVFVVGFFFLCVCAICLLLAFVFFLLLFFAFLVTPLRQTAGRSETTTGIVASATYTVQGRKSFLRFCCLVERLKKEFVQINFNFVEGLVIF